MGVRKRKKLPRYYFFQKLFESYKEEDLFEKGDKGVINKLCWRKLSKLTHPDNVGKFDEKVGKELFQKVSELYTSYKEN